MPHIAPSLHLDPQALDRLAARGGSAFAVEMLRLFVARAPSLVGRIAVARSREDLDAVRRAAQLLQASAENIGALVVADSARALARCEQPDGDWTVTEERIATLARAVAAATALLVDEEQRRAA